MNEVFEKIIERLEKGKYTLLPLRKCQYNDIAVFLDDAIKIVQEVAEEYQKDNKETITKLLSGEWVDCDKVQQALGMSFKECFSLFDFSRTAEWWCLAGKTKEEKNRNGQKITTKFKLKSNDGGWILCKERLPEPEPRRFGK